VGQQEIIGSWQDRRAAKRQQKAIEKDAVMDASGAASPDLAG